MDAVVEFLLKYRPAAFARGTLAFDPVVPIAVVIGLALGAIGLTIWWRGTDRPDATRAQRWVPTALRVAALGVLTLCLCRPVLVVAESRPQRNVVAVLVDDSRSMRLPDVDGQPRARVVQRLAGSPERAWLRSLAERHAVRLFRTSAPGRAPYVDSLTFDGGRTPLLDAIARVEDELEGTPVSGIVVLTDGADTGPLGGEAAAVPDRLGLLRARGIPVYAVGIGSERFARDIELASLSLPRVALRGATVLVDVVVTQRGYAGRTVPLLVEDEGRLVARATVRFARDADASTVRVRVPAAEAGPHRLTVRVPVQDGELVADNNARRQLLTVRDRREKILHVEGEPRPELKFARRAVDGDRQLQLVTLLRSAKDKYLRLGVSDSVELQAGFPTTRAELFTYRALVLGSIEASFFTADQLRMIADFVSQRGGGLLVLGGRDALAEGGYAGTPLEDVLPIELVPGASREAIRVDTVRAMPTIAGARHPALQVASDDSTASRRWRTLPPLTTVNRVLRAKAGATVLLDGQSVPAAASRPLLTAQRFGRGRVLALAAQDDWRWQMHAAIAVTDSTHELLWRQMLRWLVADVPDRVDVVVPDAAAPGDPLVIRAIVRDSGAVLRNEAMVRALVQAPDGAVEELALDWAPARDGEYTATITPQQRGVHSVRLVAVTGRDTVRAAEAHVAVEPPVDELFGAERRTALLAQLAAATGGRSYTVSQADALARDLTYSPSGLTEVLRRDLWDAPLVLGILLVLLGSEWALRRAWGMP